MEETKTAEKKTPKQEFKDMMIEVFCMIENLQTTDGEYLKFADMFKKMNLDFDRLVEIRTQVIENNYYRRYVKKTTKRRARLTEAEKLCSGDYFVCNCGRVAMSKGRSFLEHLRTKVHYTGVRNRKYGKETDETANFCIEREIKLQAFIIRHLVVVMGINVDDSDDDEDL